jgi:hypothetical protein
MKLSEREIREVAYHEAGHAVLAVLLNIPFIYVQVNKRLRLSVVRGQVGFQTGGLLLRRSARLSLRDIERLTLMMMAGPAVLKRLRRKSWDDVFETFRGGGWDDFDQSVHILDLATGRFWAYEYLKRVRARAVKAIGMHWDLITKIADALIERGRLTRAEVPG